MMEGDLVKRLLYLATLGLVASMMFASAALAQDYTYTPPTNAAPTTTAPTQYAPTTSAEGVDEMTPSTTTTTPLPDTGGPSLLLPAGLLLASGLIGLGVMRRK